MDGLVQINVTVSDRIYPLKVLEKEKEEVLKAVKLVNEKIREYQRMYDGKDKQDYLAMVYPLRALILCIVVVALIIRWKQKNIASKQPF